MAGAAVSPIFDQPGAAFVLLRPGIKFPPSEDGWQHKGHSFAEAAAHKGNVGLMAGKGYIGLDQDDPAAFKGLDLPVSTLWETRPGRLGMWFRCNDHVPEILVKFGFKPDQAQIYIYDPQQIECKDDKGRDLFKHVGEIKLERTYQVIPPSWKTLEDGKRANYRLLREMQPSDISLEGLLFRLLQMGLSFKEKAKSTRLDENAGKLENKVREARQKKAETDEQRTRRYAEAALRDEVLALAGTPEGSRNRQLNKSAFALGQFVAAGVLDKAEVMQELSRAANCAGLDSEEIERTIESGLEASARHPRKIPERTAKVEENGPKAKEVSEDIKAKAREILLHGDPINYIVESCGRMVLGAEKAFEKLICCMAVQGVRQSAGLHPKLNGESGSGKTWAVLTFAHHLPSEAVVKGSTSNLAAFYHDDGDQVFRILDDYQAGNETLDTIIKQTSSVFHQQYTHRTVKKQEPVILNMGSEQTWAITSVDCSQDIQVLNRQIPINVDDSEDLTRKVNARTIERYGEGEEQFPEDETVLICREIWRILRADGSINIRIPYYKRIEWLDTSNRRNPSIFMDLLIAHTAMKRYQRPRDAKGYYLADEADFQAAKALFTDRDGEELVKRLTTRERDVIGLLLGSASGLTRDDIAEKLHIAPQRVSQILSGQKGAGGLAQKVQIKETRISEMVRIDEDTRRTVHKTIYSLSDYDRFAGFDAVVRLQPGPNEPGKPGKHDESKDESKQNESSNDNEIKESKKKKERDFPLSSPMDGSSSDKNEKNTFVAFVEATDAEKDAFVELSQGFPRKHDSLSSNEDQENPLTCAVCGADLTGKGRVEKNGKSYCPRPGCGYPARGCSGGADVGG